MNYQNYRFKDFMLDEEFQQWVLNPDSDANLFWINYLQNHPDKQLEIAKAKAAIQELYFAGLRKEQAFTKLKSVLAVPATPAEMNIAWQNITEAIKAPPAEQTTDRTKVTTKVIPLFAFNKWTKIAASILLICAVGAIFWLKETRTPVAEEITYRTTFGETKKITLPDNSKIFLNANSQLTTAKYWPSDKDREVKLAGEAFFSVVHTQNDQKFKVNLQKGAQVEVLGTEFTVTNRPTLSRVVLSQGKVKVKVGSKPNLPSAGNQLRATIMAPGDLVQIDYLQGTLSKNKVQNPEQYAAFIQNKIEFNNSPLSEVARVLQDNYGYKVTFLPASLANKWFTSSNPSNRLDLLFFALEKSFNLQVIQKGKHLTIQTK
ncbi:hypothetical protein AAE02nite_37890 [Adhaeribacter aerolatus]|uniref:Uncharacterized protein n=1 Tax=Adhaeribacter aerolatus TaxID=670289 RepID=A0A512B2C9_9BACT|nr:FecR domain-containing protein [Adhaeribacter aerolatus]GEO06125.1 hypothetical protein AAE02nite_37890 [Adhaeribacter aerolatus]